MVRVDDDISDEELLRATEDAEMSFFLGDALDEANADFEGIGFQDTGSHYYGGDLGSLGGASGSATGGSSLGGNGVQTGNAGIGNHLPEVPTGTVGTTGAGAQPPVPSPAQPAPNPTSVGPVGKDPLLMKISTISGLAHGVKYKIWFPNGDTEKQLLKTELHGYMIYYRTADEWIKASNYAKTNPQGGITNLIFGKQINEEL